jgi:hypothetical protein
MTWTLVKGHKGPVKAYVHQDRKDDPLFTHTHICNSGYVRPTSPVQLIQNKWKSYTKPVFLAELGFIE